MLNLRYIVRLITTFFIKFKALILFGIVLGILFFILVVFINPTIKSLSTQRIGLTGRFTTSSLPSEILNQIGDGLTKIDQAGNVEPNLASSWNTPDKGKTWVFTIKDGLTWQDDTKVVSSTINYQFSDLETEHPDPKTIVFKLENPYSAFPAIVSKPVFKKGLLGTGNFKVKDLSLSGNIVNSITLVEKKDKSKKIYKFYPTEERTKLAFELGEVDQVQSVINPGDLVNWKRLKVEKLTDTGSYVGIFLNTQDPLLSDKNIRQALAYATDKTAFKEQRALGPISINSWAYNPQAKPYNFDLEKAKSLLKDKVELKINLMTTPTLLASAEKIIKNWKEAGFEANIQVTPTTPDNFQAFLAIFDMPEDPDQYSFWHSTQTSTNRTKFSNPRIDKLLEDGRTELNIEERKKIYLDFQRFLVEDSPAIFLYYPTTYTITR